MKITTYADTDTKDSPQSTVTTAYSDPTWFYDLRGFFILTFAYRSTLWKQIFFFGNHMRSKHLEIAVGSGTLLWLTLLWRSFKKFPPVNIVATDYVPSMLAGAQKRFKKNPNVTLELADATKLRFADQEFDSVTIANSIHCFSDVDAALCETFRIIKSGGIFCSNTLLVPAGNGVGQKIATKINNWGKKKGILYSAYYKEDIRSKILASGFKIQEEFVSGNAYYVLAVRP